MSALGPWSRRVVRALAEVVLPDGADAERVPTSEIVAFVESYVPHMPTLLRLLFPVGLMMLELGAFVLAPSLLPFSSMSLSIRADVSRRPMQLHTRTQRFTRKACYITASPTCQERSRAHRRSL